MAKGPRYHVPFRRRREGKTDFRYRLALLKSGLPRAVVRNSNTRVRVQFITFAEEGDKVLTSAVSSELDKLGWKGPRSNTPAAYLTGLLAGMRAKKEGLEEAVLDIGLHKPTKGSKVFASLAGILDAGLDIPHGEEVLPSEDRLTGAHIKEDIPPLFESVKAKIMEEYK